MHVLAERLLAPVKAAGVDALLLGCTHYPFLARTIGDVMGRGVVLVSSADETAFEVRALLDETGLGRRSPGKGEHRFMSSGDVGWFRELGSRLLGPELDDVRRRGTGAGERSPSSGATGATPGPGAPASGYLVESDGTTMWLDAGSGTLANLQRHVGLGDIDAVVLSHEHPDHWTDIEGYHVAVTYGDERRTGVPVYAPAGLREKTVGDDASRRSPGTRWPTATGPRSATSP